MTTTKRRAAARALGAVALMVVLSASRASGQRPAPVPVEGLKPMPDEMAARFKPLSPPSVSVYATPVAVTISWKPVPGASSYTVEQATNQNGPWIMLPLDPRLGTQLTAPTAGGSGGVLYYYRVSAAAAPAPPGVTVVPRITPPLLPPVGMWANQDVADVRVTWAPVPYATGYVITAAPGQQLPPTHTVEVGPQYTEARLVNVASPNMVWEVWVGVNARFGTALSGAGSRKFVFSAVQTCWPSNSVPGAVPTVSITSKGPAAFALETAKSQYGAAAIRVERAPMGSQAWQGVGCNFNNGAVLDTGLMPGTQYQYRVTDITGSGAVGQTVVVAATPLVPDNPTPTATVGPCSATGCSVTLNWTIVAGGTGYRIESSYGLYLPGLNSSVTSSAGGYPESGAAWGVPKGVHVFTVTTLFSQLWSPKAPGQVTVVVP